MPAVAAARRAGELGEIHHSRLDACAPHRVNASILAAPPDPARWLPVKQAALFSSS
jgi:hypothetical protein